MLNTESSPFATLLLTPGREQPFVALSPLPASQPRIPHTPAETEWHLGRQAESLTKLSLGDVDYLGRKIKSRVIASRKEAESSPSPIPRHRGRKRSFDGKELPRAKGELFETFADTPVATSFRLPDTPSPVAKLKCSATAFFGPSIQPSPTPSIKPSQLNVTTAPLTVRSQGPSPKSSTEPIAKKYKPRDSGLGGVDTDESEDNLSPLCTKPNIWLQNMDDDTSGLVTPSLEPPPRSVWPSKDPPENVDDFIIKTLAAGGAPPRDKKIMPGTPQKRTAYTHLRPWMSSSKAMAPSAAPHIDYYSSAPRKSLPLSFPNLSKLQDLHDPETSPSDRTLSLKRPYNGLGQGRPNILLSRDNRAQLHDSKVHSPIRRVSSGTFSTSSSEGSCLGTPTQLNPRPYRLSPRPSFSTLPRISNEYERPGKFEADFVTIDTLGVGAFGSALKVCYKQGSEVNVSAIKKSKRLEGVKHRRRLREEVDVLQHLAKVAAPAGHPNVLQYIDSWEQDDILYIHTELCELGNFATFLSEYGTHFEVLDEARVWKVCAELSNGLKFIHDSGVIHLDLKPANIFVTGDGRFKIGDFGMASLWPRQNDVGGFEREGDREYMAPEILRGLYGPAADIFSLGMVMLETATNIVVPDMGDDWHKLREDDFSAVDFVGTEGQTRSRELICLITNMMHSELHMRLTVLQVYDHPVVMRARHAMDQKRTMAVASGQAVFGASPLGGEPDTYLAEILQVGHDGIMDYSS
ncbi:kinase-like protein [Hysterangium stoloniferum]|nr:kinase-like protein [Hysterangium stoloniferum]